jgi:hypothetical protein
MVTVLELLIGVFPYLLFGITEVSPFLLFLERMP